MWDCSKRLLHLPVYSQIAGTSASCSLVVCSNLTQGALAAEGFADEGMVLWLYLPALITLQRRLTDEDSCLQDDNANCAGHLSLPRTVAQTFVQDLAGSESESRCLARMYWYSRGRTQEKDEHYGLNKLAYCFAKHQTQHISKALQQVCV